MKSTVFLALLIPALTACDQLQERLGIPVPEKVLAEGKAIGSACRHAGRGLEDCYTLNPKADKAAVHEGWKEMNEYMIKNNMQAVAPEIPAGGLRKRPPPPPIENKDKDGVAHGEPEKSAKDLAHKEKAKDKSGH